MEKPTLKLSFHYPELSFHSHRSILALLFWFPGNLIPCRLLYLMRADCPHIFLPKSDLSCSTGIHWILSPGLAQGVLASTFYRWLPHELFQSWYHLLHDLENMPKFLFFFSTCDHQQSHCKLYFESHTRYGKSFGDTPGICFLSSTSLQCNWGIDKIQRLETSFTVES